jgi:hypothetical protein
MFDECDDEILQLQCFLHAKYSILKLDE